MRSSLTLHSSYCKLWVTRVEVSPKIFVIICYYLTPSLAIFQPYCCRFWVKFFKWLQVVRSNLTSNVYHLLLQILRPDVSSEIIVIIYCCLTPSLVQFQPYRGVKCQLNLLQVNKDMWVKILPKYIKIKSYNNKYNKFDIHVLLNLPMWSPLLSSHLY